jgi:hypothetical protein
LSPGLVSRVLRKLSWLTRPAPGSEQQKYIIYVPELNYAPQCSLTLKSALLERQGKIFKMMISHVDVLLIYIPYFPVYNARVIYRKILQCIPRMFIFTTLDFFIDNARVIYRKNIVI